MLKHSIKMKNWYEYSKKIGLSPDGNPSLGDKLCMKLGLDWPPTVFWGFGRYFLMNLVISTFIFCFIIIYDSAKMIESAILWIFMSLLPSLIVGFTASRNSAQQRKKFKLDSWENF